MELVVAALGTFAALAWLVAAGSALDLALRHPAEGRSAGWYAVNGIAFFDAGNFAPSGAAAHRRFLGGVGAFVLFVALAVGVTVVSSPP